MALNHEIGVQFPAPQHMNFKIREINKKWIIAIFLIFAVGFFSGWFFLKYLNFKAVPENTIRETGYELIAPLLACGDSNSADNKRLNEIKYQIEKYISDKKRSNDLIEASVYIRQPKSGNWVSINENKLYDPASLAKVPIMMTYFKLAEQNSDILNQTLFFDGKINSASLQIIKPTLTLKAGQSYSIEDLIYYMIVNSNNDAELLLYNNIDKKVIENLYNEVSNYIETNGVDSDHISPKSYSIFFRLLYNASYLNSAFSEKALKLLTKTDFSQGLAAGLPKGVIAAQKFGERDFADKNGKIYQSELHDCGIVYYPINNPYMICVMTRGYNLNKLVDIIKNISAIAYKSM